MIGSSFFGKAYATVETAVLVVAILAALTVGSLNLVLLAVRPHLFRPSQTLDHSGEQVVALGDADGDGDLDAFLDSGASLEIWQNDGHGTFNDSGQRVEASGSYSLALGDVDGDGDLDALVGPQVWLNDGSGQFADRGPSLVPVAAQAHRYRR